MSSTYQRTPAIVLRRTNYGEADKIVTFLTPIGKRSAIARGVRKEKSRLAGGIELFAVSDIVLTKGKGDLDIITSARLREFYRHILDDYDRMQFGYDAIKLIGRAVETVDEPEWFDVLEAVLSALDKKAIDIQLIQTWFYMRYSALLGYELPLQYDVDGQKLSADDKYVYDVAEKGFRLDTKGDIGSDHIKFLRLIAQKSIPIVAQIGGIEEILSACSNTVRQHASIPVI
jgi:DNA repair protein RecO (recombination protein O)